MKYPLLASPLLLLALAGMVFGGTPIAISVSEPPGATRTIPWPVFAAVVLPNEMGASKEELSVANDKGQPVPAWIMPVSTWHTPASASISTSGDGGGGIKWLHVRFIAEPGKRYQLIKTAAGSGPKGPESQGFANMPLETKGDQYTTRTDKLSATVSKNDLTIAWEGKVVVRGLRQLLADDAGKSFTGQVDTISVERHSPIEVTLLLSGSYNSAARFQQRISFFKDVPVVFFDHAWRFMGDMQKDRFSDISVEMGLDSSPQGAVRFLTGDGKEYNAELDKSGATLSMSQELALHNNDDAPFIAGVEPLSPQWAKMTAPGTLGTPGKSAGRPSGSPNHFGIYRNGASPATLHEGEHCGDGLVFNFAKAPSGTVTAVLADFWRNFPKEWEIGHDKLTLHLWSKRGGKLDFSPDFGQRWYRAVTRAKKGGEVRTGDPRTLEKREQFLLAFGEEALRSGVSGYASLSPQAMVDPAAICAARPFDLPIDPRGAHNNDPRLARLEQSIDAHFDAMMRAVELTGGNGWQEAGHGPHYIYEWDEKSGRLMVNNYRWFNHFYYMHRNLWMQYFRSGDRKYADMLDRHFQHFLDIEVCHGGERDELSPGSWCKDSLCYWENWQEGWKFTYQRSAREVMYYQAHSGDERAAWQLRQWRDLFLKFAEGRDLAQWADEYRNWGGANFSAWRVPCTAIGNLVTLHEIFGDQRLLDMALALTLSFEDTTSQSGTRFILSGDQYEYTMWSGHDEYYRILSFYEVCRLTGDARAIAMTNKLIHYWLAQRADQYGPDDLMLATAWDLEQNTQAGSMIKTFVENDAPRDALLATLRKPFGPGGPQGSLHPSNTSKDIYGIFPYMIAAYPKIIAAGGEATALRRFESAGDFPVWVAQKAAGKPLVMAVLCPGMDRSLKFFDAGGKPISDSFVTKQTYKQLAGWMYEMFTLRLPADYPAQQIYCRGDNGRVVTGTQATYLFYPGPYLYVAPETPTVTYLRPGASPIRTGGEATFKFTDGSGKPGEPKDKDQDGFALYAPADGVLGVSASMHWTRGAYFDLTRVPVERRFGFIGDPQEAFAVSPAVVAQLDQPPTIDLPALGDTYIPGVAGNAFLITPQRGLSLNEPLNADAGCIEFWIRPLWSTPTSGAGSLLDSNIVQLSAPYVGQFRVHANGPKGNSYDVQKPEGPAAALRQGKWYHVAISWKTPKKKSGSLRADAGEVWMTIDGRLERIAAPMQFPESQSKPDAPLTLRAGKNVMYAIDELRISAEPRYLVEKIPNMDFMTYGGFDLATVRPPKADDKTLYLYRFDGNLKGEGSLGTAHEMQAK